MEGMGMWHYAAVKQQPGCAIPKIPITKSLPGCSREMKQYCCGHHTSLLCS